jgi:glycosyltransferase involved in cell wall biosynthesis
MDWYPNEDAVLHFIDSILPLIRGAIPAASLTVVGRNPSTRLRQAAATAHVEVTGTVEDVRAFVAQAAVVIVPLRVGGGTRIKIFEAMAMGKAVVSSTIGAEGLPLVDGVHFKCADEPQAFADAVVAMLRNPERRRSLGEAGRQLVAQHYSWGQVTANFAALLEHHPYNPRRTSRLGSDRLRSARGR